MKNSGYREFTKNKNFLLYLTANIINRFGDSLDSIAFTWIIYTITGSAFWSALIFGLNRLPTILLQPFLGVLVDKLNKKKILIISDVIRGICVSIIAIGIFQGWLNEYHLLLSTIFISTAEAFRMPAAASMLPSLLEKDKYESGISLNNGLMRTIEFSGLASAGVIIGLFGILGAVLIDVVTFFVCAILMSFVKVRNVTLTDEELNGNYIQRLKNGFSLIKGNKLIVYLLILATFMNGIYAPLNALEAPLVKEILHSGEIMLSVIGLSLTLGGVLGSFLYPKVRNKISELQLIKLGAFALIIMYLGPLILGRIITNDKVMYLAVLILGSFCGGCVALLYTYVGVLTIQSVKSEYLGRVNSIIYALSSASIPLASFLVSGAVMIMSTELVLMGCAIVSIIFFFTACSKRVYLKMVKSKKLED